MKINIGKFELIFKKRKGSLEEAIPGNKKPVDDTDSGIKTKNLKNVAISTKGPIDTITTLEFVSHELKGILGSTIICVYSIRDGFLGMLNFKQRATIETIIRNLRRLESTIKDFLDISKIEGGKISVNKTQVNINSDIIKEVEDSLLSEIYEKRIILENNIPDGLIINTDRTLLHTIFNNLIGNAIKYGKAGGRIIINLKKRKKAYCFSVYNDGEPLTKEQKDKLFKKFSRIETEANKKIKGTGLGLFIVKNIVKNLGGDIWVETSENGNKFLFEIEGE